MGRVRFTPLPNRGDQKRYQATFRRSSEGLPKHPQTTLAEQVQPRPGERGVIPRGTDTDTPGWIGQKGGGRSSSKR